MMLLGVRWGIWINLAGFNVIWLLSIFTGDQAILWILMILIGHFSLISKPLVELSIVFVTAAVGYSVDCLLTLFGFFEFDNIQGITPLWLPFLWLGFCSTLRHSLEFFGDKYLFSSLSGAAMGSVTYLLAAHYGAVNLSQSSIISVAILASVWALLLPTLLGISKVMSERLCR